MKPRTTDELKKLIKTVNDLNSIDTTLITSMNGVFHNATSFNQPLYNWDVSHVRLMNGMFESAKKFNQPLNNWDVSNVENMEGMFENAAMYSHAMSKWELSNYCKTTDFLKKCIMWLRHNNEDDMPLQYGKRLEIPEDLKKMWR